MLPLWGWNDCRLGVRQHRAAALDRELAVARMLWPVRAKLCRFGGWLRLVLACLALAEAIALAVHLKDVDVVCQAVEQRACQAF